MQKNVSMQRQREQAYIYMQNVDKIKIISYNINDEEICTCRHTSCHDNGEIVYKLK